MSRPMKSCSDKQLSELIQSRSLQSEHAQTDTWLRFRMGKHATPRQPEAKPPLCGENTKRGRSAFAGREHLTGR